MLLVSYASVSLIIRAWAISIQLRFAARACELAVLGYVVCALVSAILYLQPYQMNFVQLYLVFAGLLAVIVAQAAQVVACHVTKQRFG